MTVKPFHHLLPTSSQLARKQPDNMQKLVMVRCGVEKMEKDLADIHQGFQWSPCAVALRHTIDRIAWKQLLKLNETLSRRARSSVMKNTTKKKLHKTLRDSRTLFISTPQCSLFEKHIIEARNSPSKQSSIQISTVPTRR